MAHYERLGPQDASFLLWETPKTHMHVGGLVIVEDTGFTVEDVCEQTESRLALVPRFRKKLMWVPYGQGRPVWVDDPDFDIRYHVRHTGLPRPGGEAELLRLMGRLMSTPLDRSRPLWEIWLVDLPGDRRAVIHKTHHSMIDGMSGIDLSAVLLDLTRDGSPLPKTEWAPQPAPSKRRLLAETLLERAVQPAEVVRTVQRAVQAPQAFADRAKQVAQGIVSFGKASLETRPKTSLDTATVGSHRRWQVVRADLEDVKAVKRAADCTVNDVILALVAGGLRNILLSRGEEVDGLVMKASVPVSVRDESDKMKLGNKVAVMFADLPVGEADPRARIRHVQAQTADLKEKGQAVGAEALMRLADYAPPTIIALAGRAVAAQWVMNLTVTNVPGPQFPLYFLGGEVLEITPFVPLVGGTALGVAVLSYNGKVYVGLTGDWDAVPDLDMFAEGIEKSLAELLHG